MAVKTAKAYQHYKGVPELAGDPGQKKKRPQLMAVVDEDSCTGCPIPPVQIRFDECIGCQICARVCTKLTWDAIRMLPTGEFEELYDITIS